MNCLLCQSNHIKIKETHTKTELLKVWEPINIDIKEEIKLDEVNLYQCEECKLKFFDPQLAGGDKFYSELGKLDWYYLHPGKTEYDYVQKFIKEGDTILDIGAGRGILYTKITKKVNYTGLELSTKAVELAKEAGINVRQEDLLIHAADHQSFYDIVCLFQVLEHLTELDNFIKSIHLTLKSGGLFVIAVPNNDDYISYLPNYIFNLPPHHTILWTKTSLKFLAKKYDFEIIEVKRELLQDVHRHDAYRAYISSILRKIYFMPDLYIDQSEKQVKIDNMARYLYSKKWFARFFMPIVARRQKYGQSILITLKKK
jgi:2-polyprenyl-3-methyl-5-hydroxy-6-metoxy-1,4-benzoquinol methylase